MSRSYTAALIGVLVLPCRYAVIRLLPGVRLGRMFRPWASTVWATSSRCESEWVTGPYQMTAPANVARNATTTAPVTRGTRRIQDSANWRTSRRPRTVTAT